MYLAIVGLHVAACLALILIVLLQTGRGAEMGAAFGGSSQTLFGSSGGSTFMSKLTTGAAVVFMLTCLGLTYLSTGPSTKSIMKNVPVEQSQGPTLPEAKPVQPMPQQPGAATTVPNGAQRGAGEADAPAAQANPPAPGAAAQTEGSQGGTEAASPPEGAASAPAEQAKPPANTPGK